VAGTFACPSPVSPAVAKLRRCDNFRRSAKKRKAPKVTREKPQKPPKIGVFHFLFACGLVGVSLLRENLDVCPHHAPHAARFHTPSLTLSGWRILCLRRRAEGRSTVRKGSVRMTVRDEGHYPRWGARALARVRPLMCTQYPPKPAEQAQSRRMCLALLELAITRFWIKISSVPLFSSAPRRGYGGLSRQSPPFCTRNALAGTSSPPATSSPLKLAGGQNMIVHPCIEKEKLTFPPSAEEKSVKLFDHEFDQNQCLDRNRNWGWLEVLYGFFLFYAPQYDQKSTSSPFRWRVAGGWSRYNSAFGGAEQGF
jgi:hypothetical protein